MAASASSRVPAVDLSASSKAPVFDQKPLWNQDTVRDVAESVGASKINDDSLRTLTQDTEYRMGQVIVESLRSMRNSERDNMSVQDTSGALRLLDVEPMFGYDTTRPLKYGEANLGSQALYYVEDEEVELEKMINAPLPKIPKDMFMTGHYLALDGVLTICPENLSPAELKSHDLLPKGSGANPALAALSGQDQPVFKPSVRHAVSQELILYFEKIQAALMDDSEDEEVERLRAAAIESVTTEPGIHQLLPYFSTFITNQVTHHCDDVFVLRQMMELTYGLISNEHLFTDQYAAPFTSATLTCLLYRKGVTQNDLQSASKQYQLREFAANVAGQITKKFAKDNQPLLPMLLRSCVKSMLNPHFPSSVWFGAISGIAQCANNGGIKMLLIQNLKDFEKGMLLPLLQKNTDISRMEFEALVGAIMKALQKLTGDHLPMGTMNGFSSDAEAARVKALVGDVIGDRIIQLGDHKLNLAVLDAQFYVGDW
ncbi:TAF-domain-containing protein [Annulohypoxylon maeteangense]|uniref:TAF-domain-containing protein n=1 Tax=Annulohypoxylon maeteangense TaxID=1927788 RepID=UPI002007F166|nr:TAF-domain-containing protein [Annulohypoxylon maeteangense]KAI0883130.1 TAF-domain-containing protein [Annulohypoxylon maeteangense]